MSSLWPEIALIGSYPPPYGGIGVHMQRLLAHVRAEGMNCMLYNTVSDSSRRPAVRSVSRYRAFWFVYFCMCHRCKVIHLQSTNWFGRVLFGVTARCRSGKYMLSIHGRSVSVRLRRKHSLQALLTRWFLRAMDVVIASNRQIESELLTHVGLPPEKVCMIPAFIPPDPEEAVSPPEPVRRYMAEHSPLLSAVGWMGKRYAGADVYGIDMLVDLIGRLQDDFPRIGLVLSVNGGRPEAIEQAVLSARQKIGDGICFVTEALDDISQIMSSSDMFLRPTNTDGDAVSIREALYLGTPVVASDAVPRPEACVLFRTRDFDDFWCKVSEGLRDIRALKQRVAEYSIPNNAFPLIELYKNLGRSI